MTKPTSDPEPRSPRGKGPLAGDEPMTGKPIDDPAMADRANPRWEEPTSPKPDAQPLANPDGTSNVMPPQEPDVAVPADDEEDGTSQDPTARLIDPEVGGDNIREGRGGGTANPSLAEGGDNG